MQITRCRLVLQTMACLLCLFLSIDFAKADESLAGTPGGSLLVIAADGRSEAVVIVAPGVDGWERRAAEDLVKYIEIMTGAAPALADTAEAAAAALEGDQPVLLVGTAALNAKPTLRQTLAAAAKAEPVLRADAIVAQREGNRIYLAGHEPAEDAPLRGGQPGEWHYYAVVHLLQEWGCRWYLPTEFGEVIPEHARLAVGELDYVYAPPFEVRNGAAGYAWLGDATGRPEFLRRNMMNEMRVPVGHSLGNYVRDLIPDGGSAFNVPIAEPNTIEHVAREAEATYAAGEDFSLGMNDGAYESDSALDAELIANLRDKYFQSQFLTDNFMVLYNGVARILKEKHPASQSRIGFFAYVNITIPPQRNIEMEDSLVAYLAPIDIDPNHGMDDHRSPPRQEYRDMLYRWSQIMDGRVVIYDYDQGMLVWRDLPNPSHQAFRHDVKHYRDAGILGLHTEARGAYATVFLNLYLRGQLMWNPDADVDAVLEEFYPKFYGPAADPMEHYWSRIYQAWEDTIITEHEFYAIPAIYTRDLVEELRAFLAEARAIVAPLREREPETLTRNERLYLERMTFTEHSFDIIDHYTAMVHAGATQANYADAVEAGDKGLAAREALIELGEQRTAATRGSRSIFVSAAMESGYAWFTGEVQQYREILELTDGTRATLIARLPLEWSYRRDPSDTGLPRGFARQQADLTYWHANQSNYASPAQRKDYPTTEWEMIRSDLYAQAQGILHPDWQSFTGFMWYKTDVDLDAGQVDGGVRIHFPGLFSEAWLYVNGYLVEHRPQDHMWWHNDYRFHWDVDLTGKLREGDNDITIRVHNTHHNGGLFRRPFLYQPTEH